MTDPVWLSTDSKLEVKHLLVDAGVVDSNAEISRLQPAGDGNMNVTLRVMFESATAGPSTVIVKQSRPFVAKYDFIPAPIDRIEHEAAFYQFATVDNTIAALLPNLLAWIPEQHVLVLEDLGSAADATSWYREPPAEDQFTPLLEPLVDWLQRLHSSSSQRMAAEGSSDRFRNLALRKLNHQHIFDLPFRPDPPLDLDAACPGLTEASQRVRADLSLRETCLRLGKIYLGSGTSLLHGDFYPGSWLVLDAGPRVIDPEFCFAGPAEFDYGVMAAHLELCGWSQSVDRLADLTLLCTQSDVQLDWELVRDFAAVEVLRRILGVAQLPLPDGLDVREQWIEKATSRLLKQQTTQI
ncbi:MAG: phosphotransferase [Aureliella sp.]